MTKFNKKLLFRIICCVLCAIILIFVPLIFFNREKQALADETPEVLTIWQIDSFEGGRGSRSSFLQKIANEFSKNEKCLFTVKSLTADSARLNLSEGKEPEIISYGAGIYGIENHIKKYETWCYGGYCILSLESNCDFSEVNEKNTVINEGTGNFIAAAAILCGIQNAEKQKPTGAYVSLLNGKFKYLLGTQRDIFRLKTRNVAFSVKPVTQFNDLYQNISVVTNNSKKQSYANKFITYLLKSCDKVKELGLMSEKNKLFDDEMGVMENIIYDYKITAPISNSIKEEITSAISTKDENKLKSLLKSL